MKKIILLLLLSIITLSGCTKTNENTIVIANGDFGEMYIFSHMAEILIKEYIKFLLSQEIGDYGDNYS